MTDKNKRGATYAQKLATASRGSANVYLFARQVNALKWLKYGYTSRKQYRKDLKELNAAFRKTSRNDIKEFKKWKSKK